MNKLLIFLIFTTLLSCASDKKVIGTYKSNRASLGFFITTIEFKADSTFKYNFSGDLINQNLTGKFSVKQNIVYLKFYKNKGEIESKSDSLSVSEILSGNYHNYDLKNKKGVFYHLKFKIRNEKLLTYRIDNGRLVKRSKVYNGKKYVNEEVYLRKVQ
jgi:hypothetical protein